MKCGKRQSGKPWATLALVLAMIWLSGCSSTTLLESSPAGAEVTVDGEYYVGETPAQVKELPWIGSTRYYQFTKEGYEPRVEAVSASMHERHLLACMCTMGAMWPLMLFGEFRSSVTVSMERQQQSARAEFERDPSIEFGPR